MTDPGKFEGSGQISFAVGSLCKMVVGKCTFQLQVDRNLSKCMKPMRFSLGFFGLKYHIKNFKFLPVIFDNIINCFKTIINITGTQDL